MNLNLSSISSVNDFTCDKELKKRMIDFIKQAVIKRREQNNKYHQIKELFLTAIEEDDIESVQYLINEEGKERFLKYKNPRTGWNAFHKSIAYSSTKTINFLLSIGFSINELTLHKNGAGLARNCFHIALYYNQPTTFLDYLVKNGVNIHHIDRQGRNAFLLAIQATSLTSTINCVKNKTKHQFLCNVETLDFLINIGVDYQIVDNNGMNAFLYAARMNNLPLLRFLSSKNIDIHCVDKDQNNALSHCIFSSYFGAVELETIKYLVSLGINIYQRNCVEYREENYRHDLFIGAILTKNIEIIKFVYSLGIEQHLNYYKEHKLRPFKYISDFNLDLTKFIIENNIDSEYEDLPSDDNLNTTNQRSNITFILHNLTFRTHAIEDLEEINDFINIFEYFLDRGHHINTPEPGTQRIAIQCCPPIKNRSLEPSILWNVVNYLIDKGSDLLHISKEGSVLHSILLYRYEAEDEEIDYEIGPLKDCPFAFDISRYIILRSLDINPLALMYNSSLYSISNNTNLVGGKRKRNKFDKSASKIVKLSHSNRAKVNSKNASDQEDSYRKLWKEHFVKAVDFTPAILKIKNERGIELQFNSSILKEHPHCNPFGFCVVK